MLTILLVGGEIGGGGVGVRYNGDALLYFALIGLVWLDSDGCWHCYYKLLKKISNWSS